MDKYSPKADKKPDSFIGKLISTEKGPTLVVAGLGIVAAGFLGIGFVTGSFDTEDVIDTGIVECAVPMADRDPTLLESEVDVIVCDTRDSLNEDEIRRHAQIVLEKAVELRDQS